MSNKYPSSFEDALVEGWVPNPYKWRKDPNNDQYLIGLNPPGNKAISHMEIERVAPWWIRLLVHEQVGHEIYKIQRQLRILIGVEKER